MFQCSLGVGEEEDVELAEELAPAALEADAVLAFRRAANWHCTDVGFRVGLGWKKVLVLENGFDGTRGAAHGWRASEEKAAAWGQLVPRTKAVWSCSPRLPRATKRAAAAVVVGFNMVSSD